MMKITLFVFAVLLIAVAFAVPRPDEAAAPTDSKINLGEVQKAFEENWKSLEDALKKLASPENMEKLQNAFSEGTKTIENTINELTKKTTKNTEP